jgi:hypothetical protein
VRSLCLAATLLIGTSALAQADVIDPKLDAARREQISSERYERTCRKLNKRFGEAYANLDVEYPIKLLCRVTPQYPEKCWAGAEPYEAITLIFDVNPEGYTHNLRKAQASNECLVGAAASSVLLWKFEASPNGAIDLETKVTFELAN